MYSIENIEKFVKDNKTQLGYNGVKILEEANKLAEDGMVRSADIPHIMDNEVIENRFYQEVVGLDHVQLTASLASTN